MAPCRSEQAVIFDDCAALPVVLPTKYRFGAFPNYALKEIYLNMQRNFRL